MAKHLLEPAFRGISGRLGIVPEARPRIYETIFKSVDLGSLNYWLELMISAGIATLGLVLNSPAVVIGAMLISPLMGPILAAGLALIVADLYLGFKALLMILLSIGGSIGFSAALVWTLPFHSPTGEILARTQPNLLDLAVALLSGLAGSLVVCRGGAGGGITALPGVAIAVALMPPLCTVGFGVGSGFVWSVVSGSGLLFLTNLAAIIASAFVVFLVARMDSPEIRTDIDKLVRKQAAGDWLFRKLRTTRIAYTIDHVGTLRWRFVMLLAVLGILFVPLREGFIQVRDEALARSSVAEVIRKLVPSDTVVTRQIEVADRVSVRLVVTAPVDAQKAAQAERELVRRTGKDVTLTIRKVAGEEELALLRERLRAPAPRTVPDLASLRAEALSRIELPLREAWPSNQAMLVNYELGLTENGAVVRVQYQSEEPLDAAVEETLTKILSARLEDQDLKVSLEKQIPPEPEPQAVPKKGSRSTKQTASVATK